MTYIENTGVGDLVLCALLPAVRQFSLAMCPRACLLAHRRLSGEDPSAPAGRSCRRRDLPAARRPVRAEPSVHPPPTFPDPSGGHTPGRRLRSGRRRTRVRGLDRTAVARLVVDEDGRPRVELVLHLAHFRGERDLLHPIVGPLTRDERFDDPAQSVRTEQAVRNDHDRAVSVLLPRLPVISGRGVGTRMMGEMESRLPLLAHLTHEHRNPQPFACRLTWQEGALPLRQLAAYAVVLGLRVGQETGA